MRPIYVCEYCYDRILKFYFKRSVKPFLSLSDAMAYLDKEYSVCDDNVFFLDGISGARCKELTYKYVIYAELELY